MSPFVARPMLGVLTVLAALGAGQPAGEGKKVKVTVVVILASEQPGAVDDRLQGIAEEVRKRDPQLKGFKLASMTLKSLHVDQKASFLLVEDQTAQVVVKHAADSEDRVGVAVTAPRQGEIVYRTVCGKFLPIVTRYQTQNKDRLILAIRVQPCQGK